jgi:hypothetical protein
MQPVPQARLVRVLEVDLEGLTLPISRSGSSSESALRLSIAADRCSVRSRTARSTLSLWASIMRRWACIRSDWVTRPTRRPRALLTGRWRMPRERQSTSDSHKGRAVVDGNRRRRHDVRRYAVIDAPVRVRLRQEADQVALGDHAQGPQAALSDDHAGVAVGAHERRHLGYDRVRGDAARPSS